MPKIRDLSIGDTRQLGKRLIETGFQASELGHAVEIVEQMKKERCTVFFAFTANLVASGLRGIIAELCKRRFVDAVVTTAGSIDHDVIKDSLSYELGMFAADDSELHKRGINRLGNIFIPAKHFEIFEQQMQKMLGEVYAAGKAVSPSSLCMHIGKRLKTESSFLRQCALQNIPVFCPGITDGAIGLQVYFFKQEHPDFAIDVTADLKQLADIVLAADKTAAIVLGGGISKHHVIGANILRNGLDHAVYITTAQEFDGSLSGAQTREGKSWGKIRSTAKTATVHADATLAFPLLVSALAEKGVL